MKIIRGKFDKETITVYQAYNHQIANEAVSLGTFGKNFKMDRMTWIKPSFLWTMYRSGWGTKVNQERILEIKITREGFEIILKNVVLSSYKDNIYSDKGEWSKLLKCKDARCQWDPDRDIYGNPLGMRAIQLGIKGEMVTKYVNEWIVNIDDITESVGGIREAIKNGIFESTMLPIEEEYIVDESIQKILGIKCD